MNAVIDTLIIALIFATLAQAWSWLGSYAGIISLGNAVFFGIGAYAVAVSNVRGGSPWYGALGGGLFAVIIALVCGVLFLRGRGYTFALVTLGAGLCAASFVATQHWVGSGNAFAFPVQRGFLHLQFADKWPYALLALAVFLVTQGLTIGLRATRIGLYLRALRTNAVAARSIGIAARPLQLSALVGSAFVTAVAGSLFAQYRLAVDPQTFFALSLSLDIALIGIVAGCASAWAAPFAALVYAVLASVVPLHPAGPLGDSVLVVEGALIVAIALLRPNGLFGAGAARRPAAAAIGGRAV